MKTNVCKKAHYQGKLDTLCVQFICANIPTFNFRCLYFYSKDVFTRIITFPMISTCMFTRKQEMRKYRDKFREDKWQKCSLVSLVLLGYCNKFSSQQSTKLQSLKLGFYSVGLMHYKGGSSYSFFRWRFSMPRQGSSFVF